MQSYDSTWHRDTGGVLGTNHREDVNEQRELAILKASRGYAGGREYLGKSFKWQTALIDSGDPCLLVCPGSHARYRTASERQALCFDHTMDSRARLQALPPPPLLACAAVLRPAPAAHRSPD